MEEISKEQIALIRKLSDEQLVKFITEVAQYNFAKAAQTLELMQQEKPQ